MASPLSRHMGCVKQGRLVLRNVALWREHVSRLEGAEVEVSIRRKTQPTSRNQHGYYRSTLLPLAANEWGWADPSELHRALKLKQLPFGIIPTDDPRWRIRKFGTATEVEPPSMADFTKDESRLFIDRVVVMMQETGIVVPPPRGEE